MMTLRAALTVALALFWIDVQAQDWSAIQADYVSTWTTSNNSEPLVLEEGTYHLLTDGRHRIDRQKDGERTSEIFLPGDRQLVVLDHNTQVAVRAPGRFPNPMVRFIPQSPLQPSPDQSPQIAESLGRRDVGPLTLTGFRSSTTIPDFGTIVNDWWVWTHYQAPPIILEMISTGPRGVESQRLLNVALTTVAAEMFEIPHAYALEERFRQIPR